MKTSLLALLLVIVGLLAPFFLGPTNLYIACLWGLRDWTLLALVLAFMALRQMGRLALRLGMRHPGGRLRAGEGR